MSKKPDQNSDDFAKLVFENLQLLSDISDRGCDLSREVDIEFESVFSDKNSANSARAELRASGRMPDGILYIIADYSKNGGPIKLMLSRQMAPDGVVISEIEREIVQVCALFEGTFDGWEFKEG